MVGSQWLLATVVFKVALKHPLTHLCVPGKERRKRGVLDAKEILSHARTLFSALFLGNDAWTTK
jgi:hypothetical protein